MLIILNLSPNKHPTVPQPATHSRYRVTMKPRHLDETAAP